MTRRGKRAKMAVAEPRSQKSLLKYINTRNRSITTAPKGRKMLYMMTDVFKDCSHLITISLHSDR